MARCTTIAVVVKMDIVFSCCVGAVWEAYAKVRSQSSVCDQVPGSSSMSAAKAEIEAVKAES